MARYLLAISAGFFCACTVLMGGYMVLQMNHGANSHPDHVASDHQPAAPVQRVENHATDAPVKQHAAAPQPNESPFRLAAATTFLPADPTTFEVEWKYLSPSPVADLTNKPIRTVYVRDGQEVTVTLGPGPWKIQSADGTEVPFSPDNNNKVYPLGPGSFRVTDDNDQFALDVIAITSVSDGTFQSKVDYGVSLAGSAGDLVPAVGIQPQQNPIFRSDGPTLTLKVTNRPPTAAVAVIQDGVSTVVNGTAHPLTQIGEYKLQIASSVTGWFESAQPVPLKIVDTADFKIVADTLSSTFGPEITKATVSVPTYRNNLAVNLSLPVNADLLLPSANVTISAKPHDKDRILVVQSNGMAVSETTTPPIDMTTGADVEVKNLPVGAHRLNVADVWARELSRDLKAIVPSRKQAPPVPKQIQSGADSILQVRFGEPVEISGATARFTGAANSQAVTELLVLRGVAGKHDSYEVISTIPVSVSDDEWSQDVDFPSVGAVGVIVRSSLNGDHSYSRLIPLQTVENTIRDVPVSLGAIKFIDGVTQTEETADQKNVVRAREASVDITLGSNTKKGDQLIARIGGKEVGRTAIGADGEATATVKVTGLIEGVNSVDITLARGFQATSPVTVEIKVFDKGPTVVDVQPNPLGFERNQKSVAVKFSAALDTDTAAVKENYAILRNSGLGDRIAVTGASYNESDNTVILTFANAFAPDSYQIRVNGHPVDKQNKSIFTGSLTEGNAGIRDIYGNYLNGDGTGNGTDFSLVLNKSSDDDDKKVATTPLPLRTGLPNTTGEPVVFPEYTPYRDIQNGFNPSDKVVTRVARLYYFRDAHRVTQIINRRARSHNSQNASMSRQLADKARLFAEQTTDRRQSAERQAIQSAQFAREAENKLQEAQQQLRDAENTLSQADLQKRRLEETIKQLDKIIADSTKSDEERESADQRRTDANITLGDLNAQIAQAQQTRSIQADRVTATVAAIEALRERELQDRETMNAEEAKENRAIEHQFRLEVQAAKSDPDTYAAGIPDSQDPVAQVSLSVIGEGLIQMRGPRKGVNIVHTMINQIDAPVGQVRIGIHTVQVNGEQGYKMEHIVDRIGRYVNHSRFLTAQSTQMLRNAIALVASRKAQQCGYICDGITPVNAEAGFDSYVLPSSASANSSERYQEAFFGREFIGELRRMDSEFLHSGNKVLSLHSMDTTSLASALFVLSLASNDTRLEILETFKQMVTCDLPLREMEFFTASLAGPTKKRPFFSLGQCNCDDDKFAMLGENAKFVSLSGYFNHGMEGSHTINPAQREFIKLAQILKSRLITEIELKQRVLERSVIEERLGDHEAQLKLAQKRELDAQRVLLGHRATFKEELINVSVIARELAVDYSTAIETAKGRVKNIDSEGILAQLELATGTVVGGGGNGGGGNGGGGNGGDGNGGDGDPGEERRDALIEPKKAAENAKSALIDGDSQRFLEELFSASPTDDANTTLNVNGQNITITREGTVTPETANAAISGIKRRIREARNSDINNHLIDANSSNELERKFEEIEQALADPKFQLNDVLTDLVQAIEFQYSAALAGLEKRKAEFDQTVRRLFALLREAADSGAAGRFDQTSEKLSEAHEIWIELRAVLEKEFAGNQPLETVEKLNKAISKLLTVDIGLQFADAAAKDARRPLDHKKFLDMLIDDTEEKFIELVEGTRAHTAVIDDYIKRLATALDDDLNTQFYEPAFRYIREQTYQCNGVGFGQIEHTNVLTNNRAFAKVQPQATMEFDLPRRRIMIAEAMQSAQAAFNDYGALMNDPSFLALTKLHGGQPTAATHDSGDGSLVRDVLPGLPSQTGEEAIPQGRTFQPEFNSQLEALIPDPAVYKFETGTGYEIRPVIQPDGQSVVFDFNYMYTTNIREPVRADEKHLGRVKRHFIDTDVQISNYELREVSRYRVALKASRTSRGVPLLEDIPVAGALFRPQASEESSLQQNIILGKSVIFPTLYDLMGLRWAPSVADLDVDNLQDQEFIYRSRMKWIRNEVYDYSSTQVDEFLRVPMAERRADLYRSQEEIPRTHRNGTAPLGHDRFDSPLQEGYGPASRPDSTFSSPAPLNFVPAQPSSMPTLPSTITPSPSSESPDGYQSRRSAPLPPADAAQVSDDQWMPVQKISAEGYLVPPSTMSIPRTDLQNEVASPSQGSIQQMSFTDDDIFPMEMLTGTHEESSVQRATYFQRQTLSEAEQLEEFKRFERELERSATRLDEKASSRPTESKRREADSNGTSEPQAHVPTTATKTNEESKWGWRSMKRLMHR